MPIKRALAERAGFRCSWPTCPRRTLGPSEESPTATNNVGMACHISAAAAGRGARRYDPTMTQQRRTAISNGIWMCYSHGKLIDGDEKRFTVEMLKQWRSLAEELAKLELDEGTDISPSTDDRVGMMFAAVEETLNGIGAENEVIGNALNDSCASVLWGTSLCDSVRDFLVEYTRNALTHGKATRVRIEIQNRYIRVSDDGSMFNPRSLVGTNAQSGGSIAASQLVGDWGDQVVLDYRRLPEGNCLTLGLLRSRTDVRLITPCVVELDHATLHDEARQVGIRFQGDCVTVYFVAPFFLSHSDVEELAALVREHTGGRQATVVLEEASDAVTARLKQQLPRVQLVRIRRRRGA